MDLVQRDKMSRFPSDAVEKTAHIRRRRKMIEKVKGRYNHGDKSRV